MFSDSWCGFLSQLLQEHQATDIVAMPQENQGVAQPLGTLFQKNTLFCRHPLGPSLTPFPVPAVSPSFDGACVLRNKIAKILQAFQSLIFVSVIKLFNCSVADGWIENDVIYCFGSLVFCLV